MKAQEFRDMNDRERAAKLGDVKENLFRLRFQLATGQADALKKYRTLRKDRARLLTIAKEQGDDPVLLQAARPAPAKRSKAPRRARAAAKGKPVASKKGKPVASKKGKPVASKKSKPVASEKAK